MAIPSVGRLIESEGDVTGPAGLKPNDAYDLALYEDPHGAGKGILIVKTVLQILFRSGKDARGNKLEWDGASRQRFLSNYSSTVCNVWDNKHRIVTASTTPAVRDIGVFFKFDLVVMGTAGRSGISGLVIGNTAEAILSQLRCALLAVKPDSFVSPVTPLE